MRHGAHLKKRVSKSDEWHRDFDIDASNLCNCVLTLKSAFAKMTNVTKNLTSTLQICVTVCTLEKLHLQK